MPIHSPANNLSSPFASVVGDHAGSRVPDFKAALDWYREKLDFRLMGSMDQGGVTFAYLAPPGNDQFRIELVAGPGAADRPPHNELGDSLALHGWHHVCLKVDSVDETVASLRKRGVKVIAGPMDVTELQRRIAFFEDGGGNMFELTQPIPG